ncbi:MAG: hypothetical protein J6J23_03370 [Clostridia bacterium]|nr:hypothetical protein [Clostridia bacterium]
MAEKTSFFGLTKPSQDDFYDISVQNGNMDIIDDMLHKLSKDFNKPSGSYTGNVDIWKEAGAARTINTGGVGNLLLLQSPKGTVLVTPNGALYIEGKDDAEKTTEVGWFVGNDFTTYVDGVLTIKAKSQINIYYPSYYFYNAINHIGTTYTYYCI